MQLILFYKSFKECSLSLLVIFCILRLEGPQKREPDFHWTESEQLQRPTAYYDLVPRTSQDTRTKCLPLQQVASVFSQ